MEHIRKAEAWLLSVETFTDTMNEEVRRELNAASRICGESGISSHEPIAILQVGISLYVARGKGIRHAIRGVRRRCRPCTWDKDTGVSVPIDISMRSVSVGERCRKHATSAGTRIGGIEHPNAHPRQLFYTSLSWD